MRKTILNLLGAGFFLSGCNHTGKEENTGSIDHFYDLAVALSYYEMDNSMKSLNVVTNDSGEIVSTITRTLPTGRPIGQEVFIKRLNSTISREASQPNGTMSKQTFGFRNGKFTALDDGRESVQQGGGHVR